MSNDRFPDESDVESEEPANQAPRPKRTRIRDDFDAVELADEGTVSLGSSVLSSLLLDPETLSADADDEEALVASDDELEEARNFNLDEFRSKEPALRDAYEDFVRIHEKHKKFLTDAETASLLAMVHSGDQEMASMAEDRLIRHNVKWIVSCLKRAAGAEAIRYAGDFRNDLMAEARLGFLEGIRKFDVVRAGKSGIVGQEKTLLGYCQIWISKRVREYLPTERFGLNQDAALDRNKVLKAREELLQEGGKMPTSAEIAVRLEQKALRKLQGKQIANPTPRQLSRAGALKPDRIDELLQHATTKLSLDAPTGDDENDGPTMAQYVSQSASDLDGGMLADELRDGISNRMEKIPNAQRRDGMRMRFGLASRSGLARHPVYNPEEVGVFMGRTRDSIALYEEELRRGMLGEETVSIEDLLAPNLPASIGQVRAMKVVPPDVRAAVAKSVSLPALARADGVRFDVRNPKADVTCPFCPAGATLHIDAAAFSCSGCGRSGDAVDWVAAIRKVTPKEALLEVMRLALAIPPDKIDGTTVTVTRDPVRRGRMQQLN